MLHTLEAQLEYSLRAHKCGLGVLAIGTLVTRESGPNIGRILALSGSNRIQSRTWTKRYDCSATYGTFGGT